MDTKSMRRVLPAAQTLVDEAGMPRLGVFAGEFARLNLEETTLRASGIPLPKALVRFRVKEWFHAGVLLPRGYLGFAIINSKMLGLSFTSYINLDGTGRFEHSYKAPARKTKVPADMRAGEGSFAREGYELRIETGLDKGTHRTVLHAAAADGRPAVDADLTAHEDPAKVEAMIASLPVGASSAMYSHKAALVCEGTVRIGGEERLGAGKGIMVVDYHRALYPRHTFWKWATAAGFDASGGVIGFNLTKNVVVDDWEYNENCLWTGGKMHLLAPAVFARDPDDIMKPWHVRTADGAAELVFTPVGQKSERVRMVVVRSDFFQVYGTFRGTIRAGGEVHEIRDMFGTCEDHDARW